MASHDEAIAIEYEADFAETDDAIGITVEGEDVWLPKSQVEEHDRGERWVLIPEWLAIAKGLV